MCDSLYSVKSSHGHCMLDPFEQGSLAMKNHSCTVIFWINARTICARMCTLGWINF